MIVCQLSVCGLLFLVYWFVVRMGAHIYYVSMFAPVMVVFALRRVESLKAVPGFCILIAMLLGSTSLIRYALMLHAYRQGMTLQRARRMFETDRKAMGSKDIYLTGSLWALTEDFQNVKEDGSEPEHYRGEKYANSVIFLQQSFTGGDNFGDFIKVVNRQGDPAGIKVPLGLAKQAPGWGYTIYKYDVYRNRR